MQNVLLLDIAMKPLCNSVGDIEKIMGGSFQPRAERIFVKGEKLKVSATSLVRKNEFDFNKMFIDSIPVWLQLFSCRVAKRRRMFASTDCVLDVPRRINLHVFDQI